MSSTMKAAIDCADCCDSKEEDCELRADGDDKDGRNNEMNNESDQTAAASEGSHKREGGEDAVDNAKSIKTESNNTTKNHPIDLIGSNTHDNNEEKKMEAKADGDVSIGKSDISADPTPRFCRGLKSFDQLEIRVGSFPTFWKNDIPILPKARRYHEAIVIPSHKNNNYSVVVLGGNQGNSISIHAKTSETLGLSEQHNPFWCQRSLPDMNEAREDFGAIYLNGKIYAIGGRDGATGTFEVLDMDNTKSGWTLRQLPPPLAEADYCRAITVDNRYIYALFSDFYKTMFYSYDTLSCKWDRLKDPEHCGDGFGMTSITIRGEGSYVILLSGQLSVEVKRSVQAYHVESQLWFELPALPDESRLYCMVTVMANRYILVAGGRGCRLNCTSSVLALDWEKKVWFELPSLPEVQSAASSVMVPAPINKWIITGGYSRSSALINSSFSLDIAPGIGWAKEKQLLLAFHGKAQRKGSKKICPLEGLPSGIFARILSYLIVPFPHEVRCKWSIFASLLEQSSSPLIGKRDGTSLTASHTHEIKKSRTEESTG